MQSAHPTNVSRRQWLRSSLALGAYMLPTVRLAADTVARRSRGVIVVMLEGGMSHLDSWDPKPDAPEEIRGEFRAIATRIPGLRIGEHLPLLAQQAHRFNLIRSVHCDARNDHSPGMHLLLTGWENVAAGVEMERSNGDHPSQGAVIAHQRGPTTADGLARFVALPRSSQLGGRVSYTTPAFLCASFSALDTGTPPATAHDPMLVPPSLRLSKDVPLERLQERKALLANLNRLNSGLDSDPVLGQLDAHQQRAWTILSGQMMAQAFELDKEPVGLRERYGNSLTGQILLLARRLVEAGVTYVLVNPSKNSDWDTHGKNFAKLKENLLPPMDRAVAFLLEDLDQRGLLAEVLVVLISEMGRTPIINKMDAGRDHWTSAYSVMLAGGGLTRGQVLGSTTSKGEKPNSRPVTVPEILTTVYQQLGIDPNTLIYDLQKRPIPILPEAKPIAELIG